MSHSVSLQVKYNSAVWTQLFLFHRSHMELSCIRGAAKCRHSWGLPTALLCDCDSVTWYDGQASPHSDYCEMFLAPDPSKSVHCDNCTSGPASCICSGNYMCSLDSAQLIDLVFGVTSERSCATLCFDSPDCLYYSWYTPASPSLQDTCTKRTASTTCFSGPSDCIDTDILGSEFPLCYTSGAK